MNKGFSNEKLPIVFPHFVAYDFDFIVVFFTRLFDICLYILKTFKERSNF